ncbi:MAG: hypothetical protein LC644_13155, partial [Pseudonocardia sp.]|nr:hypothetical protein [Pseudonocardia sp.]
CSRPDRAELLVHSLPEVGDPHTSRLGIRSGYRDEVFPPDDPTGLSSTAGQLVILFGLLSALVVLIRWWWQQRNR